MLLKHQKTHTATKRKVTLRKTKVNEIAKEMMTNSLRNSDNGIDEITEANHKTTINIDSDKEVGIKETVDNISDDDDKEISKPKQSRKRSTRIAANSQINNYKSFFSRGNNCVEHAIF